MFKSSVQVWITPSFFYHLVTLCPFDFLFFSFPCKHIVAFTDFAFWAGTLLYHLALVHFLGV
ncbi:hypothetical protein F5Y17DRAFT_254435 [Xylariaceae sp. FL0594]|nr:hypothetical protein F5Y17DRAFT_254435 [Xylariaceae sp. FL0594]